MKDDEGVLISSQPICWLEQMVSPRSQNLITSWAAFPLGGNAFRQGLLRPSSQKSKCLHERQFVWNSNRCWFILQIWSCFEMLGCRQDPTSNQMPSEKFVGVRTMWWEEQHSLIWFPFGCLRNQNVSPNVRPRLYEKLLSSHPFARQSVLSFCAQMAETQQWSKVKQGGHRY